MTRKKIFHCHYVVKNNIPKLPKTKVNLQRLEKKVLNLEENLIGKSIITWQNQITKHLKNEWTRTVLS